MKAEDVTGRLMAANFAFIRRLPRWVLGLAKVSGAVRDGIAEVEIQAAKMVATDRARELARQQAVHGAIRSVLSLRAAREPNRELLYQKLETELTAVIDEVLGW